MGSELKNLIPGARAECFIIGTTGPDTVSVFLNAAPDPAPFAIAVVVTKKFTVHSRFQIQSFSLMLLTGIGTGTAVNFTRPKRG